MVEDLAATLHSDSDECCAEIIHEVVYPGYTALKSHIPDRASLGVRPPDGCNAQSLVLDPAL